MLDEYRKRRDNIHAWLTAHPGIKCVKPKGAFYLFPDISALLSPDGLKTSADFAQALLEKEHVVVTPGEAFDAPGYLRISYADVDGAAARRREPDPAVCRVAAAGEGRRRADSTNTTDTSDSIVLEPRERRGRRGLNALTLSSTR